MLAVCSLWEPTESYLQLHAGSKVAVTSIIHMIWEMAAILIAYKLLRIWKVRSPAELNKLV